MGAECLKNLYFVIRNYGSSVDEVCKCLGPLLKEAETQKALEILNRDFSEPDDVGPNRVARFLFGGTRLLIGVPFLKYLVSFIHR